MELHLYCDFKSIEVRNSKNGDKVYYYLTVNQKNVERHLCIFDDKSFEMEVDKLKTLSVNTSLDIVCNYSYKNNKGNLSVVRVGLWTSK